MRERPIVPSSVESGRFGGHNVRQFVSPNDLHIKYYSWNCTQNCIQPEFQWIRLVKEKLK
jgi:hypothetical protein